MAKLYDDGNTTKININHNSNNSGSDFIFSAERFTILGGCQKVSVEMSKEDIQNMIDKLCEIIK